MFRAAISAFCSLERPTRQEVSQLDDLTLGLFHAVPAEARRFAAAALCECDPAPTGLVRRLSDEPVEIAAPLLVRSPMLSDVDLIGLIGRHGLPHARAIARRDNLNPVVAALIRALLARADKHEGEPSVENIPAEEPEAPQAGSLDEIRSRLRDLMQEKVSDAEAEQQPGIDKQPPAREIYLELREAVLTRDMRGFGDAIARVLGLSPDRARSVATGVTYSELLVALRALGLGSEQAFLLTVAAFPAQLTHPAAIRLFLERYGATSDEAARLQIEAWQQEDRPELEAVPPATQSVASAR